MARNNAVIRNVFFIFAVLSNLFKLGSSLQFICISVVGELVTPAVRSGKYVFFFKNDEFGFGRDILLFHVRDSFPFFRTIVLYISPLTIVLENYENNMRLMILLGFFRFASLLYHNFMLQSMYNLTQNLHFSNLFIETNVRFFLHFSAFRAIMKKNVQYLKKGAL